MGRFDMERNDDTSAIPCSNTEPILEVGQVRSSKIKPQRKEAKCGIESIDGEDVITPKDNLLVRICRRGGQGKAINHALAGLTFGRGANQISKDMAERKRNAKGQFVKGNQEGHHFPKGDAQRETARLGGIASQAAQKRNKMLKEELREILNEETVKGSGITKQQSLIQNILKNTLSKGKALDLKILCEVLGELEINVNLNQTDSRPTIKFSDE